MDIADKVEEAGGREGTITISRLSPTSQSGPGAGGEFRCGNRDGMVREPTPSGSNYDFGPGPHERAQPGLNNMEDFSPSCPFPPALWPRRCSRRATQTRP